MGKFAVVTWYTGVCRYTAGVAIGTAAGTGFAGATSTAAVWQHNSFNIPHTQQQIDTFINLYLSCEKMKFCSLAMRINDGQPQLCSSFGIKEV